MFTTIPAEQRLASPAVSRRLNARNVEATRIVHVGRKSSDDFVAIQLLLSLTIADYDLARSHRQGCLLFSFRTLPTPQPSICLNLCSRMNFLALENEPIDSDRPSGSGIVQFCRSRGTRNLSGCERWDYARRQGRKRARDPRLALT